MDFEKKLANDVIITNEQMKENNEKLALRWADVTGILSKNILIKASIIILLISSYFFFFFF